MNEAAEFLKKKAEQTEAGLRQFFDLLEGAPPTLTEAMAHSLFAGGKRLRPALCLGACELACGDAAPALPAACALEMVHTYSLIHDDLPAMDDDELRRGRPTCHVRYGEATAILAGDALLTLAFEVIAQTESATAVGELAQAAGAVGMVGGQIIDLASEDKRIGLEALQDLHARKTGALIRAAVRLGAVLGGADAERLDALTAYGEHLGLAFQIADDILDVTGSEAALGKRVGADAVHQKSTYPALLGLERAQELGRETVEAALAALAPFGPEAGAFRTLARFVIDRNH